MSPMAVYHLPTGSIVAAFPINSSCSFCNAEAAYDLGSTSRIQLPVPVQVNVSTGLPGSQAGWKSQPVRPWRVGDNQLLDNYEPTLYAPRLTYLPPEGRVRHVLKLKPPEKLKTLGGMDKWYFRRQLAQLQRTSVSRNKLRRTDKMLKRLQQHHSRHVWKIERRLMYEELEGIRQSKLELLQRKGLKAAQKEVCPLWNCPRKEYHRKRPFMPLKRTRSASSLSDLSKRSRSPIIFHKGIL